MKLLESVWIHECQLYSRKESGEFMISTEADGIWFEGTGVEFSFSCGVLGVFSCSPQPRIKILRKHLTSQSQNEEMTLKELLKKGTKHVPYIRNQY